MTANINWRDHANEAELSRLFELRSQDLKAIAERKRIRDRCYQRARRKVAA